MRVCQLFEYRRGEGKDTLSEWITKNIWVRPDVPGDDSKIKWIVGLVSRK